MNKYRVYKNGVLVSPALIPGYRLAKNWIYSNARNYDGLLFENDTTIVYNNGDKFVKYEIEEI